MSTSVHETERKYEAPTGVALPELADLPGVAAAAGPEEQRLEAVYYDTADLRLARAGLTLRRRVGGDDAGWHLKLPVAEDTREEVRLPPGRAAKHPPKELGSLVQVHARGDALTPVARIQTTRQRWQLVDERGKLLVEVVEDLVSAQDVADASVDTWREIEVELGERGDLALLDQVERRLAEVGITRSTSSAKLTRLLSGRLTPAPPPPKRGKSAGDVVLAYLREQADALKFHDPKVRRKEEDAVHQMRVASRRMRSALQAFGKVVDRERTRELTDELKWFAGVLGDARDAEVMRAGYEANVAKLDPTLVLGSVSALLTRHFAPMEAGAHESAMTAMNSRRYFSLLNAVDALIADPPLTPLARGKAKDVLPKFVVKTYTRLARHAENAHDDESLHESRKAAKRLRYAVETVEPLYGKSAQEYRKRLKDLQTLLGDHQDSVVARPVLRELGAQAFREGENGFTFGLLHGLEQAKAARVEEHFPAVWRELGTPKFV
ncbi:CYTH and CHAD domain-containing protein [Actinosynnema sp. NPDC047251]|uniref:CHAD domain containing protein n=1 Tax=Saccharothrix espanaensis (strain ATCC 51144 / DSM 44229 / JCM 9112 / NBRC 15066 / NRRL 15764) TaxID=1179773 RepID=K0JS36_SACES|nr:CYTH and CHAD domain-containing protein [Saccharothrix espanaensis]CCH28621.1 CHAD domain containing protein [Saccharothrix espanaensis DSM 44229]